MAKKKKLKRENLVTLLWSPSTEGSEFLPTVPSGVIVDLAEWTWTFKDEVHTIGETHPLRLGISNIIGIYDRSKDKDLEIMKLDIEFAKIHKGSSC